MAAWLIGIAGLSAAFGFELPKVTPDKGAPYRFGQHYDYDNAGSSWNYERVYRHPGHRHYFSRWYCHYGQQPKIFIKKWSYPYRKHSDYFFEKYDHYPGRGYSRHKARIYSQQKSATKGYSPQKIIHLRDRITNHSFNPTRSFNRGPTSQGRESKPDIWVCLPSQ